MSPGSAEYIYGLNPAFEVLRAARRTVYLAHLNAAGVDQPRLQKLTELLQRKGIPIEPTEKGRLIHLADSRDHQGVVIKVSSYPYVLAEQLWDRRRLLLLDNIEDPHNVGAILRSAEVFGFHGILMASRGVPDVYPSVVKVSAGATEFLQISKHLSANQAAKTAIDNGFQVIALDAKGTHELRETAGALRDKVLLVIGGEDKSVGQYILNLADRVVRIEQRGRVNSLNASVAASIAMFTLGEKLTAA